MRDGYGLRESTRYGERLTEQRPENAGRSHRRHTREKEAEIWGMGKGANEGLRPEGPAKVRSIGVVLPHHVCGFPLQRLAAAASKERTAAGWPQAGTAEESGPAWLGRRLNTLCVNHRLNHMKLLIFNCVLPIRTISCGSIEYLLTWLANFIAKKMEKE